MGGLAEKAFGVDLRPEKGGWAPQALPQWSTVGLP